MTKFYLLIGAIAFFDLLAIYSAKMALVTGKNLYAAGCVLGFGIAGYFFVLSLKYDDVAIVNVLWIALSIILVAVMGHYLFGENLSRLDILAMVVIMIGIVLLNLR